jgi:Protein of unknown function (DUF2846)
MSVVRTALTGGLLVLCACASVPMARPERDLAAKKFEIPPDQALLYVYRDETYGSAIKLTVLVDGRHVGDTAAHTFLLVPVAAGPHVVVSKAENDSTVQLTAENGKAYFVWQEVKMGLWAARSELHVMNAEQGRAAVATCSLIEPPPGIDFAAAPSRSSAPAPAPSAAAPPPSAPAPSPSPDPSPSPGPVPASATEGFPRALTGAEIAAHFARNPVIEANQDRQPFRMTVQPDNRIERVCSGCRVVHGTGEMKFEADRVCIRWMVKYPDSGCFRLVQLGADQFILRGVDQERPIKYKGL